MTTDAGITLIVLAATFGVLAFDQPRPERGRAGP